MFRIMIVLCSVLAMSQTDAADDAAPAGEAELLSVTRIWDQAPHNAFTGLVRYKGKWYCAFREGADHVCPDGSLRVIASEDGDAWESMALLTSDKADLRDAQLCVTPAGELMLSGAAAMHDRSEYSHQTQAWFSQDGREWSEPVEIGDRNFWLWRVTWHKGTAYAIGYATDDNRMVRLYTSEDGRRFTPLVENLFDEGYPNETSLVFLEDDRVVCLLRRDATDNTAQVGLSKPPYTDWEWHDLGVRIGGPHAIQLPDGRLVAGVRLYDGQVRTALCRLDPGKATLDEFMTLPSGGDTSYPGLVWHEGILWMSYYSTHEERSSIYLAKIRLPMP